MCSGTNFIPGLEKLPEIIGASYIFRSRAGLLLAATLDFLVENGLNMPESLCVRNNTVLTYLVVSEYSILGPIMLIIIKSFMRVAYYNDLRLLLTILIT
jgi:hypothetical protein